jgi:hypothetical protein|tara:strand:+ start:9414 stop:9977 length:564 start_codon:yes stop_codon:yes gene_type:complete
MINKIIHSFDEIKCQKLFEDFIFIHWTEKEIKDFIEKNYKDKLKFYDNINFYLKKDFVKACLLHRYGGIFINKNLDIQKNFYNNLDPVRLNILERYENNQIQLDDSMVAIENNMQGLMLILDDIINDSLFENVNKSNYTEYGFLKSAKELYKNSRHAYKVLPHTQFNVKQTDINLYNKEQIYIINGF